MTLDSELQRDALLQLLRTSTFSGEQIEFVNALYHAIKCAAIENPKPVRDPLKE